MPKSWLIEGTEKLPQYRNLILANHPPLPYLIFPVFGLSRVCSDLSVAMDAGIGFYVDKLKLFETIGVNTPRKEKYAGSLMERLQMKLVRKVGDVAGAYRDDGSQFGEGVVDKICSGLLDDRTVLLFPQGQSRRDAKWKSGAARVINEFFVNEKSLNISFLEISLKKDGHLARVLEVTDIEKLNSEEFLQPGLNPNELCKRLQWRYNSLRGY